MDSRSSLAAPCILALDVDAIVLPSAQLLLITALLRFCALVCTGFCGVLLEPFSFSVSPLLSVVHYPCWVV